VLTPVSGIPVPLVLITPPSETVVGVIVAMFSEKVYGNASIVEPALGGLGNVLNADWYARMFGILGYRLLEYDSFATARASIS